MGIKGGHSYTHSISGVSIGELFQISRSRKKSSNQTDADNNNFDYTPTIDIDASWVYRSTGISIDNRLSWLINFGLEFVRVGFIVVFVCDGENRHHSKRATIQRKAKYQRTIIDGYIKRTALMNLAEKRLQSTSVDEISAVIKQESELSKKIKSMERMQQSSAINVGDEFFDNIKQAIEDLTAQQKGNRNGKMNVIRSQFQADSVLAYRCLKHISDIILCSDSDLAALAGSRCLGIKNYKFNERSKTEKLSDLVIFTPSVITLNNAIEAINLNISSNRIKKSNINIFDNVSDMRIRGLLAVGLGCDVYLPGIHQMGKQTLKKFLDNEQNLTYDSIINFYYDFIMKNIEKKNKQKKNTTSTNTSENVNATNVTLVNNDCITENILESIDKEIFTDAMNIFVDSFIYEPTNYFFNEVCIEAPRYITEQQPHRLHKYIEEFGANDLNIEIYESRNILINCIGTGSAEHIFLSFEDHSKCFYCENIICKYCTIIENDKNYCFQCYTSEIAVVPLNVVQQPTLRSMRHKLLDVGIETSNEDNINDIADLYDAIIENEDTYVYDDETIFEAINLPLHESTYLDNEKVLLRFDLKNGASFIRNTSLTLNNQIDIICLLSKLVQTGNIEYKEKNNKIYSILPDLIVNFAERSRMHSGYRLLKRAVRHALDPEGMSIISSNCCIVEYEDTTGIHINHDIKASMKKDIYNVKLSFTSNDILSCTCTCKAGSIENEKVLCVHILPVIMQLSLLLFDGLSEHLLVEVANEFHQDVEKNLSTEKTNELRNAIILLKRANSDIDLDNLYKTNSINDLLINYKVGTESFKKGPGPPSPVEKLGPLRDIKLISPLMVAKNIIEKKNIITNNNQSNISNDDNEATINNDDNIIINTVPYYILQTLHLFVKNYFHKKHPSKDSNYEDCIGFKLLQYRSNKCDNNINAKEINILKKKLLVAFIDANQEFRFNKEVYLSVADTTNIPTSTNNNMVDNNISNIMIDDDNNNINNNNDSGENQINKINNKHKKRYTCCVLSCNITSTNSPNMKFIQIPRITEAPTSETLSEKQMHTYQRNKFIRKEWMSRLGLGINNPIQNLNVCNKHELEYQDTNYVWKNKLNKDIHTSKIIRLPKHNKDPPLRTRNQYKTRQPLPVYCQFINKRKVIDDCILSSETNNIINSNIINKSKRYCAYAGCRVSDYCKNNNNSNITFSCIPKEPNALKLIANNTQRLRNAKRVLFRKLFLKSIGVDQTDNRTDLRVCNQHKIKSVRTILSWTDTKQKKQSTIIYLNLPAEPAPKNKEIREAKGLGMDRYICKTINIAKENIKKDESLTWAMSCQQTMAIDDGPEMVHQSVARAVGIDVHQQKRIKYSIINKEKIIMQEKNVVRLDLLSDETVKFQTGFGCKASLLSFIIIVCNGNIDNMTKQKERLTWFEEWYFVFERCYSRSLTRWVDYENKYERSESFLRQLFDIKMKMLLTCRKSWPPYVSLNEDEDLRSKYWNKTYAGKRVVMWDNTCIHLPKPQDPEAQRNTFSAYYAGNVGKGAIFIQLCGWLGTYELYVGAISDSDYFTRSGLLLQQKKYIEQYDKETNHINWINILDRGYRVTSAAWRTGNQFVLQPSFARSDRKFSTLETLRSAAVASDRGANERAVRLSKMSGQLHNGITGNKSLERLSDLWLTWSFQCNFIYKPVC